MVIYDGPGSAPSSGPAQGAVSETISSSASVRGPQATAGAIDRAHLSEDTARSLSAEGRRDEAIALYRLLLAERPGDPELRRLLDELLHQSDEERGRRERPRVSPSATGPYSEPFGMLDLTEPPETYDVDEVEILYKDPWWAFVYWEVTDSGLRAARAQLDRSAEGARLVLRVFSTPLPAAGQPGGRELRDIPLAHSEGRRYIEVPRPGSQVRVAVGLLTPEGFFASIAHSSLLRLPPPTVSAGVSREWLQVAPARTRGLSRERISSKQHAEAHQERVLAWRVAAPALGPGGQPREALDDGEGEGAHDGSVASGRPLGSGSGSGR